MAFSRSLFSEISSTIDRWQEPKHTPEHDI